MPEKDESEVIPPDTQSCPDGQRAAGPPPSDWIHPFDLVMQYRDSITGIVVAAGLIGGAAATPAHAACLGGPQADNNCLVFDRRSDSQAEVGGFADGGLSTNRWFRIGFSSSQPVPAQSIKDIEYSYNNGVSWNLYGTGITTAVSPLQSVFNGPAVDKGSAIGSNQFRYRFVLPGGIFNEGTIVRSTVSFDNSQSGLLTGPQTVFTRQFLSDFPPDRSAPGPLPGMGAMMTFVWSRRLRRRLRKRAAEAS